MSLSILCSVASGLGTTWRHVSIDISSEIIDPQKFISADLLSVSLINYLANSMHDT